ncbi:MAG: divalent cation tolerance protein CutA [bacterium]|nr:divalent cation tolerance protein CutA [bacterium]
MNALLLTLALILTTTPVWSQEQISQEEHIARIAQHVAEKLLRDPKVQSVPDAVKTQLTQIASTIAQETPLTQNLIDTQLDLLKNRKTRRKNTISSVFRNLLKAFLVIATLLLLRWSIDILKRKWENEAARSVRQFKKRVKIDFDALAICIPTPSISEAETLGRILVEARLAASADITAPLRVLHPSQPDLQEEVLLLLKTRRPRLTKLQKAVKNLHSKPNGNIFTIPIFYAYRPYLEHLKKATRKTFW